MQTQSKPTTVLLVVIALLLAANLIVSTEREAEAREVAAAGPEPYVVQISNAVTGSNSATQWLYRLWSDGAVDVFKTNLSPTPGSNTSTWWGWVPLDPVLRADLNADGCVNVLDLIDLLLAFGDCATLPGEGPPT